MTKRTKVILIVCAVITVLAVVAGITAVWFFSDGVHVLGPVAGISIVHIDIDTELYAYDYEIDEPSVGFTGGKTRLRVSVTGTERRSWSSPTATLSFDGDFEVPAHPVEGEKEKQMSCSIHDDWLVLLCSFVVFDFDSENEKVYFDDARYNLYADRNSDDCVLFVGTPEEQIYYVSTQDEARAEEILHHVGLKP